jgi:membrane-associated phospholipid phosphatase
VKCFTLSAGLTKVVSLFKKFILLLIIFVSFSQEKAQEFKINNKTYLYEKPSFSEIFTQIGQSYSHFYRDMTSDEYFTENMWMIGSTAFLIYYDQPLYEAAAKFGRDIGIGNGDGTTTVLTIGDYPIFRGPTDVGSTMYFFGDGWFHISIALGFYGYGEIADDNRALQTAMQIGHGMLTAGIFTQTLKHITGRETPNHATVDAGKWRFFPDQIEYHKKVPKYDAFPSGHLATAMMTLTVIAENYAEYDAIYPIGIGMMTLLSYQMMNNGVHWASDYPLALIAGYLFGKIAVDNNRKLVGTDSEESNSYSFKLYPHKIEHNFAIGLSVDF